MAELALHEPQDVDEYFGRIDAAEPMGYDIVQVAIALNTNHNGRVPCDKAALKNMGVDSTAALLLISQCFGATELIVGNHARKILTALDMVDWEEVAAEKSKVKMSKLPGDKIKRSLRTWLKRGAAPSFHDTMDTMGNLLSARTQGDWGKIKATIQSHFSPKDKQQLLDMCKTICQFYKATRNGGRAKLRPVLEVE